MKPRNHRKIRDSILSDINKSGFFYIFSIFGNIKGLEQGWERDGGRSVVHLIILSLSDPDGFEQILVRLSD